MSSYPESDAHYRTDVTCPEFDVIGMSFPGVPGFAHFGHNQSVARPWCGGSN